MASDVDDREAGFEGCLGFFMCGEVALFIPQGACDGNSET
jgi:hypothetical protein